MKVLEAGFTIIELLIATAIFSVILIITTTTIIGISQTYVKGSVEGQTQQTSRAVLTDISEGLQFNNSNTISVNNVQTHNAQNKYYFCIGNDEYVYQLDVEVSSSNWGLIRYPSSNCSLPSSPTTQPDAEELLANNERLGWLDIPAPTFVNGIPTYIVDIEVGYGSNSLLSDAGIPVNSKGSNEDVYKCLSGPDSSFCAVSVLTTTVAPRVY